MASLTRRQMMRRGVYTLVVAALLAGSAYCGWRDYQERQWLAVTAQRITAQAGARTPRERAVAFRDFLRSHVTYHGARHNARPFLRDTAKDTIESGLGYCGESTRAFVRLAQRGGLRAQRVNLHGRYNHVVAEVELGENRFVLFDPQLNPGLNRYFDSADITVDQLITQPNTPFNDYSNLNLRRVPIIGSLVRRLRIQEGPLTRTLESPWLTKAALGLTLSGVLVIAAVVDRMFVRLYARRFGLLIPKTR